MIQQSVSQLQVFMNILWCSRRKHESDMPAFNSEVNHTTECNSKGSEPGDVSTDDASDHSGAPVRGGGTDSDMESSDTTLDSPKPALFRPPPGLEPPPLQDWSVSASAQPSLQQCARSRVATAQTAHEIPHSTQPCDLKVLNKTLDRLNPAELTAVKALLDMKMHDAGIAEGSSHVITTGVTSRRYPLPAKRDLYSDRISQALQNNRTGATHAHRTFTPFGQANRTKEQKPLGGSLREQLLELSSVEDSRVLSLRKIGRLGFNASASLQAHLSKFGSVERVMVSSAQSTKTTNYGEQKRRMRPAALGFAVMSKTEEATAALNHGMAHIVAGVEISVLPFQSHGIDGTD